MIEIERRALSVIFDRVLVDNELIGTLSLSTNEVVEIGGFSHYFVYPQMRLQINTISRTCLITL